MYPRLNLACHTQPAHGVPDCRGAREKGAYLRVGQPYRGILHVDLLDSLKNVGLRRGFMLPVIGEELKVGASSGVPLQMSPRVFYRTLSVMFITCAVKSSKIAWCNLHGT